MSTTPDRVVVLTEHSTLGQVELTPEQAEAVGCSTGGLSVAPTARVGHYDIRSSHLVGTVTVPGLRLVIKPKLSISCLLHLLTYSRSGPSFGELGRFGEDKDLLEAMGEQFSRLLRRALSRGLVQEYRLQEEDLISLRGRPDVVHLLTRRYGVVPPLRCQYDEYSADTLSNRLMLAACEALSRSGLRGRVAADLRLFEGLFEGVERVRYSSTAVPHPKLDRRHAHAVPAIRLAEAILRHLSIYLRDGGREAVAFTIDMNALYEDFVVEGLRQVMGLRESQWIHHPRGIYLDTDLRLRLSPDALWRDGRRPILVLDAKYKSTDKPIPADVYQMVAYCNAIGVDEAVLVYASTVPDRHVLVRSGVRIHRFPLDPDGTPAQIEARLKHLADTLSEVRRRAHLRGAA